MDATQDMESRNTIDLSKHDNVSIIAPVCDRAVELLTIGWTQGAMARGKDGHRFPANWLHATPPRKDACQWCLTGSIYAACNELGILMPDTHKVFLAVHEVWLKANRRHVPGILIEGQRMIWFNDLPGRTKEEVIASLERIEAPLPEVS